MADTRSDSAPSSVSAAPRGGLLRKLALAVVILVVALLVVGVLFLDSIVRTGIAKAGTHVLGVPTSVEEVSIGLVSGHTEVRGLEVDNPTGYAPVKFLSLGAIEVDAPFQQLTGDKIVIDRVRISELVLDLEKGSDGRLNVEVIVDNLKKATGAGTPPEQVPPDQVPPGDEAAKKEALVKELRLESMRVNLRNIAGGKDGVVEVKLPDLVLRDLSSKGGVDVLASELSGVVIGSVMQSVIAANIEGLGAEVVGHLQGAVGGLTEVVGGALDGAVRGAVSGAGEALKAVGKGLGDIGAGLKEGAGKMLEGAGGAIEQGAKGVGDAIEGLFGGKKQ